MKNWNVGDLGMDIHRWGASVGAAFIFMLLAVGAVNGEQATFTVSPPNPVANQPITLTWAWTDETYAGLWNIRIYKNNIQMPCVYYSSYEGAPIFDYSSDRNPITVTLTAGLPAGTFVALVAPYSMSGACNIFTVSPA